MKINLLGYNIDIIYVIGIIMPILFILISIIIWYLYGKDIKYKNILKKDPPSTLNPLEFYLVYNGYLKEDSIMPMLIYLSNKEYFSIVESPKTKFILKRNKKIEINNSLNKLIINIIFKKNEVVNLTEYLNKKEDKNIILDEISLKDAINNIESNEELILNNIKKQKNKYFEAKSDAKRNILLIMITTILLYVTSLPFINSKQLYFIPISSLFSIITLYILIKIVNKYEIQKIRLINVLSIIFTLCFIWIIFLTPVFSNNIMFISTCFISIISVIIILYIYKYMAKRTTYGTKLIKNIEGFKDYIINVPKEELNTEDEYINNLLPYTYILGINDILFNKIDNINIKWLKTVDKWSNKKIDNFFNKINKSIIDNKKMLIKNK